MPWWMYVITAVWLIGWAAMAIWAIVTTWEMGAFEFLIGGVPLAIGGMLWPGLAALFVPFWLLKCLVEFIMASTNSGPYRYYQGSHDPTPSEALRRDYEFYLKAKEEQSNSRLSRDEIGK